MASILRRSDKPVVMVVNKVDDANREVDAWAFSKLGLGEPVPVSALHGRGSGELLDMLIDRLPSEVDEVEAGRPPGTPTPGTTSPPRRWATRPAVLGGHRRPAQRGQVDAVQPAGGRGAFGRPRPARHHPGRGRHRGRHRGGPAPLRRHRRMRRKSRIDEGTEYYSLVRALQAVDQADAVLLVVDATEGVTHQDQRLAERVDASGCAWWSSSTSGTRSAPTPGRTSWPRSPTGWLPVLRPGAQDLGAHRAQRPPIPAGAVPGPRGVPPAGADPGPQRSAAAAQTAQPPPIERGHRPRVLYATQGATDPPTFTLFTTRELPAGYLRYLERKIREAFSIGPTPIKLRVRRRSTTRRS